MSTLDFEIGPVEGTNTTVLKLVGDGAAANVSTLEKAVTRVCAMRPHAVVLDLSGLTFIASLCMGCFVALRRSIAAHGGTVRLAAPNEQVATALSRAKLDAFIPTDATIESSFAAIADSTGVRSDFSS